MPECPECHKNIDKLQFSTLCTEYGEVTLRGRCLDWETEGSDPSSDTEFSCPECYYILFTRESDVVEFLQGEEEEKPSMGLFLCEKHNIRYDNSCPECQESEVPVSQETRLKSYDNPYPEWFN